MIPPPRIQLSICKKFQYRAISNRRDASYCDASLCGEFWFVKCNG